MTFLLPIEVSSIQASRERMTLLVSIEILRKTEAIRETDVGGHDDVRVASIAGRKRRNRETDVEWWRCKRWKT